MDNMLRLVVLACLMALSMAASGVTVTPFTGCTRCAVEGVLFPSSTAYLMQTADKVVWRSADEGQTWTKVLSNIDYMEASPVDPLSVLFISGATLYTSTDGGQTTTKSTPPNNFISGITMHPVNPSWILTYICTKSVCSTYYSKDFGKTWKNGPTGLALYFILWSDDPDTPDNIFAVRTQGATFSYTSDYGQTWTSLFPNSIGYVLSDHYLYVGVVKPSGTTAQLYSSSSRNDPAHTNKNFYWLAEFPTGNDLPEQGYTFLDDTTRSEFVAVKQPSAKDIYGTLFSSDFDGDQFALSLNYIAQDDLLYDFDKFNGLAGIYVANAYPAANSPATARQTLFSFDNGGEWQKLIAPKTNNLGIPTNCSFDAGCSLHIHGIISWYNNVFPPFYSSPNAIGLMVAVGNTGTSLAATTQNSKTYFTRDAGLTWAEIFNAPTIYEFGNHGGILVFAPTTTLTTTYYYSLDEGLTTQSGQFSNTSMYVDNIFIEPQGTGKKFVLIAHTGSGPNVKNYIFGLDFTGLNLPTCGDNDYENFIPHNGDSSNVECFMGTITTYTRRKQTSQCYNDRNTDHVLTSEPCKCAWEDYECDVGFTASGRNESDYFTCTPIHSTPTCATGYRLIPDTGCDINGGLDLRSTNCPGYSGTPTTITTGGMSTTGQPSGTTGGSNGGKKSHTGAVAAVVIIFIVLFGGAGTVGFLYYKNEAFREWVLSKFSRNQGSAGYGRVNTDENDEEEGGN